MNIKQELDFIFENMSALGFVTGEQKDSLLAQSESEESLFWEKGKQFYHEYLQEHGLVRNPETILQQICALFPEDIAAFPEELRKVVVGS